MIYRQGFYRMLSVLKMRCSAYDLTLREITITAPVGTAAPAFASQARNEHIDEHEHASGAGG